MISISNLRKTYNKRTVLNIPNLTIKKGEVFGLVGNNGAGKTTFLRAILDLISIDNGEIRSGEFIVSKSEDWKDYTLSYIDESFLIDFLTPEEYFYFIGNTYGYPRNEIKIKLSYYKDFFSLTRNFEYVWYGKFEISNAAFEMISLDYNKLLASL